MANELSTKFEQSGIAADRILAVEAPGNWQKAPPQSDSPNGYSGRCLADNLNYAAQKILSGNIPGFNGKSQMDEGFVVRALPKNESKSFFDQVVEMAFETSGAGGTETQLAQVFARHDRFNRSLLPKNTVFSGYTFFTRPRLNLQDYNICGDRKFGALMTRNPNSLPFAIKCLLDTQYALNSKEAGQCPLFDKMNPFNVPLCNAVKSISGFVDPTLTTETTEGGFFSEDQTCVIGGDRMSRTYDLNVQFRDFPGSPILAMIDYWSQYMANLMDGSMMQYADAIDLNRMDYTVSIYRFLMDRTNRYIVRWAKCTGCYPISPPSGVAFNMNDGNPLVDAASELSVPFKCNRIEYDDPVILKEFNMLVRRYHDTDNKDGIDNIGRYNKAFAHNVAQNNFAGVPYIRLSPYQNRYELIWIRRKQPGEFVVADDSTARLRNTGRDFI